MPQGTPDLEMRHLRGFLAVAEDLNFTRAAARLHLSQQALSKQVQDLEVLIGAPLFRRTTRRVELTAAGEELAGALASPLEEIARAIDKVARHRSDGDGGSFVLAYVATLEDGLLPELLERIHAGLPEVRVSTYESWTHEAVRSVAEGRSDLALAYAPKLEGSLTGVAVGSEALGAVLPRRSRWSDGRPLRVAELEAKTLAVASRAVAPGFVGRVEAAFPRHWADGRVYELERYTRATFRGDRHCRDAIEAGDAFFVTVELDRRMLGPDFVWLPLDPYVPVPVELVFDRSNRDASLRKLIDLALAGA
jgi:DNA-binding transcriptional LysR family regulator